MGVATSASAPPTWERPGLGGAVRPEMGSPQPGERAPDLALPNLEGRLVSLGQLRGSWVLLHFTATWCPFCDSEIEHLGELAVAFAPRGIKTVIVDVEESAPAWGAYAKAHVVPEVVALHDASGKAAARFAPPRAQPSFEDRAQAVLDATLLIDPEGAIRLFLLPDSAHFDPTFRAVRGELDRLVPTPVVTVDAGPQEGSLGARTDLVVNVQVAPGFHIMADRPSAPNYIPTRVTIETTPGIEVGDPLYPAASSFALGDRRIAVFEGTLTVRVPAHIAQEAAAGLRRLRGVVRYQACTGSRCLFPTEKSFELPLTLAPGNTAGHP